MIEEISIKEMKQTVERYILEKKGVKIDIMYEPYFHPLLVKRELYLLNSAYNVAKKYFDEK